LVHRSFPLDHSNLLDAKKFANWQIFSERGGGKTQPRGATTTDSEKFHLSLNAWPLRLGFATAALLSPRAIYFPAHH
jgi:hypothetical protein